MERPYSRCMPSPLRLPCDDRTSGFGPQRRSKWAVSRLLAVPCLRGRQGAGGRGWEGHRPWMNSRRRAPRRCRPTWRRRKLDPRAPRWGPLPPGVLDGAHVSRAWSATHHPGLHTVLRVKHGATLDQLSLCCSPSQAPRQRARCATRAHKRTYSGTHWASV